MLWDHLLDWNEKTHETHTSSPFSATQTLPEPVYTELLSVTKY